jgi:predicted flap endonuclease-1-like 5' DNA nuclease
MKGVGPRLAERLNTVGVTSFAQIAALTPEAAAELDSKLGDFQGRLERDRWIEQAGFLASGDTAGFEEKFGKL